MKKNFKIIFLLLVGILSTLPLRAENYGKTFHIDKEGFSINAMDFLLHEGAGSPEKLNRIVSKNGYYFFINLPEGHNISDLHGGIIIGDKIKVTSPGTLDFEFTYESKRYLILAHVNYKGVLQYQGSDAPETIEVTEENENSVLGVPAGKFPSIGWLASPLEENNFQLLHTNFTQNSMSLDEILKKAKEKFPNVKEFFLKGDFYDGTSNGQSYSESEHIVQIKDKRVPTTYSVSLSAQPAEGGTVSGAGNYEENSSVRVTATPASGWRFVRWLENGEEVSTSASYTFTITGNRNLVAHFEQIPVQQYSVNLTASPAEGGSVSGSGSFNENSSVTVSASPASGWRFVKWTENGAQVSDQASYSFTITNNRHLVAHFEQIPVQQYSVSLTASPAEGGSVSGAGTYTENSSVTVSASPASGWRFVKWTEGGAQVSDQASYSFTITNNRNLVAHFEQIPVPQYSVILSAQPSEGGQVTGAGNYDENSQVTVSATANSGWKFVRWTENGAQVSTSASFTFQATTNRNLVANFKKKAPQQVTITATANPSQGGSVQGAGTVNVGTQVTLIANPASDYEFVNWTESGSEVSTSASYSFQATTNRNLVANFKKKTLAPPTSFEILNAYQRDAIISWQAGGNEKMWEISYGDTTVIVTEPRLTLRRLSPNTDYTIEVRAKVGETLSDPLMGTLKTESFSEKHNRILHIYGMQDVFSQGEILPIFWKDMQKLPKKISFNLSPTPTSEEKATKIFAPIPEAISFNEKGRFILTFKFEGLDKFEEITFLLEVK